MTAAASARTFDVRHLQLARAAFAAIAAVMVTFSTDHSATVGLAVFGGFAFLTGLVLLLAVWMVFPRGNRWPAALLAAIDLLAATVASITPWRSAVLFFALVIAWALLSGFVEALAAWLSRRGDAARSLSRDGLTVGILTMVLGVALLLTPADYALDYFLEDAGRTFTLTGITIAVGIFGGYAAIVAVYLGIAGFSPRREPESPLSAPPVAERAPEGGAA